MFRRNSAKRGGAIATNGQIAVRQSIFFANVGNIGGSILITGAATGLNRHESWKNGVKSLPINVVEDCNFTADSTILHSASDIDIKDVVMNYKSKDGQFYPCLLYTSPSPRDLSTSRMPSSA